MNRSICLLTTLLAAGCVQVVEFPPDLWQWDEEFRDTWDTSPDTFPVDTDTLGGGTNSGNPLNENSLRGGCTPGGDAWIWETRTNGWGQGVTLYGIDDAGTLETHPMRLVESNRSANWDRYQVGPVDDGVTPWVAGVSSSFDCDDASTITWAMVFRGRFGDLEDCVHWGSNETALESSKAAPGLTACRWLDSVPN